MTTTTALFPGAAGHITVKWLCEKQVSEITGISVSALQKFRHRHVGIPYCRIGKSIRYSLADIERFMAENRIVPVQ